MSSMAVSLLPMPLSPRISTPSPYTSISTPWRVIMGASSWLRKSMVMLVNSTEVCSVRSRVRPYFCAISMHSGNTSSLREMTSAGISYLNRSSKHLRRSAEEKLLRNIVSALPMIWSLRGSK